MLSFQTHDCFTCLIPRSPDEPSAEAADRNRFVEESKNPSRQALTGDTHMSTNEHI